MSKPSPAPSPRLRYIGAIPVTVYFPTGRYFSVSEGDVLDLLPSEADGLTDHPDFTPEEG